MEVDSWLTGRRAVSLPFTDECSPLCSELDSFNLLLQATLEYGKSRQWRYVEIRGGRPWFKNAVTSTAYLGHRLALRADEASHMAELESSFRRAVRKAEKSGVTVTFSRQLADLRQFYDLLCQTRKRHGVPPQPWTFFANFHRHILATGQGYVALAQHQGNAVAGAVFLQFGRSVTFKYGASHDAQQELRANNLVMWEAIKRFAREGFSELDFGRTSIANEGLRRFKLGLGATESVVEYVKYDLGKGAFVTARDEASGWYNHLFRLMPGSLAKLAGRLLYPHIA
jgi:hypothetical protein